MAVAAAPDAALGPPPGAWGGAPGPPDIWPTPPQRDLLRATLLPDGRALEAWQRIRPLMDLALVDGSVTALLPQLRANLQALGCPEPMLELFKGVHRYTWARNQLLLAQAMPVVGALESAGIHTLLLKGAALLAGGRHEGGVRPMTDIDVLVPPDSVDAAVEVFLRHGMATADGSPLWYAIEYGQRYRNSWNFQNPDGGQLDLHWHVMHWSRHPEADREFWSASEPVELRGVQTRALCPADELLTAMAHGLRWDPSPTYRWVLDAALIARAGSVDWQRLAEQARRRRMEAAVGAGLRMLGELSGIEVPDEVLRSIGRGSRLQRLELRAQSRRPQRRSAVGQAVSDHLHDVRRSVEPGGTLSPAGHLRVAVRSRGITRLRDLPELIHGGLPGPSRPECESAAPIGSGACSPRPLSWGVPLELGLAETVREHCLYGLWLPQEKFAWIAGREAALVLELPEPANSSLVLTLSAGSVGVGRRRLQVAVEGERVGEVGFSVRHSYVDRARFLVPRRLVAGRSRVTIRFRASDPVVPARAQINDDLRLLGVNLHEVSVRPAGYCRLGEPLALDLEDSGFLAEGWGEEGPSGRLTRGPEARLVVGCPDGARRLQWDAIAEEDGDVRMQVRVNGTLLRVVEVGRGELSLPDGVAGQELVISWRIQSGSPVRRLRQRLRPGRYRVGPVAHPLLFRSVTLV